MGENEITKIVTRLDGMEARRIEQMKEHEKEIRALVREEITAFRSSVMWFVGLVFGVLVTMISFITVAHFDLQKQTSKHENALKIVISKMNYEHPSYMIEDLDDQFNPHRGI